MEGAVDILKAGCRWKSKRQEGKACKGMNREVDVIDIAMKGNKEEDRVGNVGIDYKASCTRCSHGRSGEDGTSRSNMFVVVGCEE